MTAPSHLMCSIRWFKAIMAAPWQWQTQQGWLLTTRTHTLLSCSITKRPLVARTTLTHTSNWLDCSSQASSKTLSSSQLTAQVKSPNLRRCPHSHSKKSKRMPTPRLRQPMLSTLMQRWRKATKTMDRTTKATWSTQTSMALSRTSKPSKRPSSTHKIQIWRRKWAAWSTWAISSPAHSQKNQMTKKVMTSKDTQTSTKCWNRRRISCRGTRKELLKGYRCHRASMVSMRWMPRVVIMHSLRRRTSHRCCLIRGDSSSHLIINREAHSSAWISLVAQVGTTARRLEVAWSSPVINWAISREERKIIE